MPVLKWGLLGTARINRSLIPPLRLSPRNELVAVASRTAERAKSYAETWSIPRYHGSYEALLADPDIDVVYIPLPNHLHAEWAIRAAEAGKHILCEKPLALTVEDVDRMAEATSAAGVVLIEAFMYRFHARTRLVREMVDAGDLGEIHHIKGAFTFALDRPGDIRWDPATGGGSLWDVGCYPLSFARYIAGREPEMVFGNQTPGASGIDVSFTAQLHFGGGLTAQFDCGFRSQFRMHVEVTGSEGSLFLPMAFKPDRRSYIHIARGNDVLRKAVDGNPLYLDEVEEMASCILEGRPSLLPLSDSRANVACIEALYESAHTGGPVPLPPKKKPAA